MSNQVKFSEESQYDLLPPRTGFVVERKAWDGLRRLVGRFDTTGNFWSNAAWSAASICFSFVIAGVATPEFSLFKPSLFSMLSWVFAVAAALLFIANWRLSKGNKTTQSEIFIQMSEMEVDKVQSEGRGSQTQSNLTIPQARSITALLQSFGASEGLISNVEKLITPKE